MSRTRTVLAVVSLLPVLLVAGCSDDEPEPKFGPTPSATPSSAPPSTAEDSRAEQEAFINQFFAEVTSSISSGDPSPFLALAPDCKNCRVIAANLEQAYANGGRIEGGRWTVVSAAPAPDTEQEDAWSLQLKTAEERWLDANDELVKVVDPATLAVSVLLRPDSAGWRVGEMKLQ